MRDQTTDPPLPERHEYHPFDGLRYPFARMRFIAARLHFLQKTALRPLAHVGRRLRGASRPNRRGAWRTCEVVKERYAHAGAWEQQAYEENQPLLVEKCGLLTMIGYRDFRRYKFDLMRRRVPEKPRRVLEIGIGCGLDAELFSHAIGDAQFTGIDIGEARVEAARARLGDDPRFSFLVMNAAKLEFPDGCFDVIYSNQALEQMASISADVVSEIVRVLAPGGRAVLMEPVPQNSDFVSRIYQRRNNFNEDLIEQLASHPVRILENFRMGVHGLTFNHISLVVVEMPMHPSSFRGLAA